jgi:hypothetical protein
MCSLFTDNFCDAKEFLRDKSARNSSEWKARVGNCARKDLICVENDQGKVVQVRLHLSEIRFFDSLISKI